MTAVCISHMSYDIPNGGFTNQTALENLASSFFYLWAVYWKKGVLDLHRLFLLVQCDNHVVDHLKTVEVERAKKETPSHLFTVMLFFHQGPPHYIVRVFMTIREVKHAALPSAEKMAFKRLDDSTAWEIFPRYRGFAPLLLANDVAEGSRSLDSCSQSATRLMAAVEKCVHIRKGFPLQTKYKLFNSSACVTRKYSFIYFDYHV